MSYRSTFISSPASDTIFLLACPLLVLGGLLLLLQNGIITLTAFVGFTAIYTAAHHLPGFLRAYGTREIFDANRARLLTAPVLIFATVALFEWQGMRGYIVVLWFFNWWHTAMQNYGLMRVYERKSLPAVNYSVKLDLISIIVWHFTASELLSDDMRFELSQHLYNLGVSNAAAVSWSLWTLRWIGVAASIVLLFLYVRNSIAQFKANATIALNKQIFLLSTYGLYFYMFYYFTKDVSTSVESFFHNTQYLFFAWVMQRRLAERNTESGSQFNWIGSMFSIRDKGGAILVYGGAIAAWGYLLGGSIKPRISAETIVPIFNVLYATAAFLHYYTDSFIWKARTRQMSATLGLKGGGLELSPRSYSFSFAELAAMLLIPMILAGALTNPNNPGHQSVRDNQGLATFSAAMLSDRARWPSAAVAAADVGDFIASTAPMKSVEWYQRAVSARSDYADAFQALGHVYSQQRQHLEAADAYEKALALDPTFAASWNNLGNAYSAMGQVDKARSAYERALAQDPTLPDAKLNLERLLARLALLQGNHAEAVGRLKKVIAITPEDPSAYLELSRSLFILKNYPEAEASLDALIKLAPNQAAGYIGKAQVNLAQEKNAEAERLLDQAIRVEASSAEAHGALGAIYARSGRVDLAMKHLEEAVKLDPAQPEVYFEMGSIWEKRGDRSLAMMYFNQAARYKHQPAIRRLQELAALQRGSE